jgi:hypothetical protein
MAEIQNYEYSYGPGNHTPEPAPTAPHKFSFSYLKAHAKEHWKELTFVILATLAAGLMVYTLALQHILAGAGGILSQSAQRRKETTSPLTGVKVTKEQAARPTVGIMVENSPDARPQSGMNQDGIVFEAVAEGGITRFLVVYQESRPQRIGPVRSLRPYYLDWGMGFDAAIAHVGGSSDAIDAIRTRPDAKDLDQFTFGSAYERSSDRVAPHNVYTSMDKLDALQAEKNYHSKFESYKFTTRERPTNPATHTSISVAFSSGLYSTRWDYQAAGNKYLRFLAGAPHLDKETGQQLAAKNVVVINMPTTNNGKYAVMNTLGTGSGTLYRDGTAIEIRWSKESPRALLRLKDVAGKDVQLNPGTTWFAISPA